MLCLLLILMLADKLQAQQSGRREEVDKLYITGQKFLTSPDSLIKYADQGYEIAKAIGYKFGEASHLKLKGVYEHRKGNFDKAISHYKDALAIYKQQNNEQEIGKVSVNIAMSYSAMSDFLATTQYALEALKIFERINFANGIGRVLNLLGITAFSQKDFQTAKKYFMQYNAFARQAKDSIEIASSYNNIGTVYQNLKKPDSTIYYLNLAGQLQKRMNNMVGLGMVYENIGSIHLDVTGDNRKAIAYYQKSLKTFMSVGATQRVGHAYFNIGSAYSKLKDTVQAKKYLYRAIKAARVSNEKEILQKSYQTLSELDAGNEKFREAYLNIKTSLSHADSIWSVEKLRTVEELKTKYDTEQKELKIRTLNQQNQIKDLEITKRNYLLLTAAFVLISALVIVGLIYSRQRLKAEAHLQAELSKQQDEAAKAVLQAEERERQRIAADLHDGVGQLLSTALLSLKTLMNKVSLGDPEQVYAERSAALVTESYNEVRSISHQMIPNALVKSGLVSAVRDFLETVNSDQLSVDLSVSGLSTSIDQQTEIILYRVIQESVNNVIKYARASKLHVQLTKDEGSINLSVEDNGVGFNVDHAIKGDGIGLRNMISRVKFLKGTIDFDSKPGKGTLLMLTVPV